MTKYASVLVAFQPKELLEALQALEFISIKVVDLVPALLLTPSSNLKDAAEYVVNYLIGNLRYKNRTIHNLAFHLHLEHLMVAKTPSEVEEFGVGALSYVGGIEEENAFNFGEEVDLE